MRLYATSKSINSENHALESSQILVSKGLNPFSKVRNIESFNSKKINHFSNYRNSMDDPKLNGFNKNRNEVTALSKTLRLSSKISRMSYADDGSEGTVITRGGNSIFANGSREGSV